MTLNLAIADYLKKNGLKQAYIAEKCRWTRNKTSRIILGYQQITAEDLRKICEALGVPIDYFYRAAQ